VIHDLPKSVMLQWQEELISQWLNTPGIPDDARDGLLEILSNVKKEMGDLPDSLRQADSKS